MRNVLKVELKKGFLNRLFLISLFISSLLSIITAIICIYEHYHYIELDLWAGNIDNKIINPELAGSTLFTRWIGGEFTSVTGTFFYLLMPLSACLSYGWSYFNDEKSGYLRNICIRTKKETYIISKYITVFLTGGFVTLIPIILNLMIVSAFIPSIRPDVFYDIYYEIHPWSTFYPLFFKYPYLYLFLKISASFLFSGLIATITFFFELFLKNKIAIVITPFLCFLGINYLSNTLLNTYEFSPIQFLHTSPSYIIICPIIVEAILIFVLSFLSTIWKGKNKDVF